MLKKHGQIFQSFLFLADMLIIGLSWISAYFLRFYLGPIPVLKGIAGIETFLYVLVFLLPVYAIVFKNIGLYEPMRSSSRAVEIHKIFNGSVLATLIFITLVYLFKEYKYSRIVFIYFFIINTAALIVLRYFIRLFLGWLRKSGYNLRHVLIVGDEKLAQDVAGKLTEHSEYGFKVVGFLSREDARVGLLCKGAPVVGTYKDIKTVLRKYSVDQLVLALPFEHIRMIKALLGQVHDEMVEIKIVPDLYEYFTLRQGIEDLDGIPIIGLRESPLYGWNKLFKRVFDIVVSLLILFVTGPILLLIVIYVKTTSPGPVFYKQRRMGLDGKPFKIIKFRTMMVGAEKHTGPVWAREHDHRRTPVGSFLRKTNLDELPQFYNVLCGQMSIVGPRPERPEFMEEFKKRIPEYMLRHKMKAGITGWAQINGLRGNTSIEERTKFDFYYIEHWSFLFDVYIVMRSIFSFANAY